MMLYNTYIIVIKYLRNKIFLNNSFLRGNQIGSIKILSRNWMNLYF